MTDAPAWTWEEPFGWFALDPHERDWAGTPIFNDLLAEHYEQAAAEGPPSPDGEQKPGGLMPGPIISRSVWGARYADGFANVPLPATEVWLHHSATTAPGENATLEQDVLAVRVLEKVGQTRFGGGISYTFVIPPSGRIFEGHSVDRRGAHTAGHNTVGRAICLAGNYDVRNPSTSQVDSVRWLLARGKLLGWWTRQVLAGGHRDVKSTACPGGLAYRSIPSMNVAWVDPSRAVTLRRGDSGEDVRALQAMLPPITVDGDFGALTEAAVKAFQLHAGLVADGIAGPKTLGALGLSL